jgi:hypothetical protein
MEYTVCHLYNSAFNALHVYVYKATYTRTYSLLSQMNKFTHSDFTTQLL